MTPSDPILSVVIPSYNSERSIQQCLDAVINQQINFSYEIIVVDSSVDDTPEMVKSYLSQIRYFHLSQRAIPSIARNFGISHAKGNYIAFTDSDCIVDRNWLGRIMAAHSRGYDVVCGSVANGRPGNLISIAEYFLEFRELSEHLPKKEAEFFPSCNFSIKANLLRNVGGFPSIRASEDMFLSHKIRQKGEKILFDPSIRIYHLNRDRLMPFLKNQLVLGTSAAMIRRILPQKGAFLAWSPALAPLIPVIKLIRTLQIIMQNRFPFNVFQLLQLMAAMPFYFMGLVSYSLGFSRGVRAPRQIFNEDKSAESPENINFQKNYRS